MEFDEYQAKAILTDQEYSDDPDQNMMIPLLGMAGEAGSLLSEFKKKIRDKNSYEGFESGRRVNSGRKLRVHTICENKLQARDTGMFLWLLSLRQRK